MNNYTVAYVRLSQDDLDKYKEFSESIYNQLGIIKSFASTMNLSIDKEYIDDGYSGLNFNRPGFEELKKDIEDGSIRTVIVKDLSRLGRNFLETAYYISEYFKKYNIRFIAINDEYDSDNEEDATKEILLNIRTVINDRYARETGQKLKQVFDSKTNEGQFIGFQAPYGYKIKKINNYRTLEIDEYAATIVKRIFTEIASGKSREEVAKMLNEEKVVPPIIYLKMTPSKNKAYYYDWSGAVIYRILKNKTYTGKIVKRKSVKKDYYQNKRKYIVQRDRETIDKCHPAIITDELFEAANNRLKQTKRRIKNDYNGVLGGLVYCGECGRKMLPIPTRKSGERLRYYFQCTNVINRVHCHRKCICDEKLLRIITFTINELINTYVDEDEIVNNTTKDILKKERNNLKISNIKENIELHTNNIKKLYMRKTNGDISLEEFMKLKDEETLKKKKLESELKSLIETTNIDLRKKEIMEKYHMFLNNDSFINETINYFIERIDLYKDKTIKISFKFGLGEPKRIKLF